MDSSWTASSGRCAAASLGPNPLPTDTPTPTPTLPPTPTATPTPIRPVVEDVTPGEVKAGVAGSLQIAGRNYQPGAAARLGGGLPLSTTYASAELLLAHVPAMGAGQYDVGVVNPDGYAGVKGAAYRVVGPAVTDLYGFDYELKPARQLEAVGEGTYLYFVVHRLGGGAPLADVRVAFYLGDPADGGQLLGEGKIVSLAPNGFFGTYVAWTPTAVGTHEIYAVIDPANQVAEGNEANNTYRSWAEVKTAAPQDKTPPVVDRAHGGAEPVHHGHRRGRDRARPRAGERGGVELFPDVGVCPQRQRLARDGGERVAALSFLRPRSHLGLAGAALPGGLRGGLRRERERPQRLGVLQLHPARRFPADGRVAVVPLPAAGRRPARRAIACDLAGRRPLSLERGTSARAWRCPPRTARRRSGSATPRRGTAGIGWRCLRTPTIPASSCRPAWRQEPSGP